MFLRKIVQLLKNIRSGQDANYMMLEHVLYSQKEIQQNQEEILRNQKAILDRLAAPEVKSSQTEKPPDEWMQQGIDNIMSYQVGKKKEDSR